MTTDAVYVTYYPDIVLLQTSIAGIIPQVRKIYIVDNTPQTQPHLKTLKNKKIEIIYLKDNCGIAYAQNIGIKKALKNLADFIMLSDQDTCYPKNYLKQMLPLFSLYPTVAAVAPRFIDKNKIREDGFIKVAPVFFRQFFPQNGVHEVMQAIASGKILNAQYLAEIGLFNENLFIDWVDLEWCWRARKKGYKILANADVTIEHRLGHSAKSLGYREVNIRNPTRHYYNTRNAFYLALYCKDLDILHRLTLLLKSFRYLIGYPVLAKPHLLNLKLVFLGFYHGLVKKLGKLKTEK